MARAPQAITLADVDLVLGEGLVATHYNSEDLSCSVEHAFHRRVAQVMEDIEQSLVERLGETTISDVKGSAEHNH